MKIRVIWTETYTCSKVVEAETEDEAMELCYDTNTPDTKEFEGTSDWSAIAEDELNPNED